MQITIGKQWGNVGVRTIYNRAVLVVSQGDDNVILPKSRLRHLIAKLEQFEKKSRG